MSDPTQTEWERLRDWRDALPADDRADFDSFDEMTKRHLVRGIYDEVKGWQAEEFGNPGAFDHAMREAGNLIIAASNR